MDRRIIAVAISEGSKLISELLKLRVNRSVTIVETSETNSPEISESDVPEYQEEESKENKASSIEAGCIPCSIGHLGTCSGLLAESLRFGRKDGLASPEVIDRVNMCLDELNTMERVDLRPEMIATLSPNDKQLANEALNLSRDMRHRLEGISKADDLEEAAAIMQTGRKEIGKAWFQPRLAKIAKETRGG